MIIKSYEVQKNKSNLSKYNFFLLYGENFGLKKDIKDIIKIAIKQKNDSLEMLSVYETEIFDNEENFYNSIYSGSLFSNKKIITIFDATDKIMKKIDSVYDTYNDKISILFFFSFNAFLINSLISFFNPKFSPYTKKRLYFNKLEIFFCTS